MDENSEVDIGFQTPTSPPKSELALQKGFRRRTWTGPAWLDNVTSTGHVRTTSCFSHLQVKNNAEVVHAGHVPKAVWHAQAIRCIRTLDLFTVEYGKLSGRH